MKMLKILFTILVMAASFSAFAQENSHETSNDTTTAEMRKLDANEQLRPEGANNPTFRDDSTDATISNSNLSGSSGTATTSGAGGLGTIDTPQRNTSSDIYTMERRDSIRKANKDSVNRALQRRTGK